MKASFETNLIGSDGGRARAHSGARGYPGFSVDAENLGFLPFQAVGGEPGVILQISSAQLLALRATPQEIITAPGPGFATVPVSWQIYKPAGAAYTLASDNDLVLRYSNAAGAVCSSSIELTGMLNQTTAQVRMGGSLMHGAGPINFAPVENVRVSVHMLGAAEVTGGDSPLIVHMRYIVVPTAF